MLNFNTFALAQIIGIIAGLAMLISSIQKTHKKIMLVQLFEVICSIVVNILLQGYAGVITNCIALVRNYFSYKEDLTKEITTLLVMINLTITMQTQNLYDIFNWIPFIASTSYTYGLMSADCKTTKKYLMVNVALWGIYNIHILAISSLIINVLTFIGTLSSMLASTIK